MLEVQLPQEATIITDIGTWRKTQQWILWEREEGRIKENVDIHDSLLDEFKQPVHPPRLVLVPVRKVVGPDVMKSLSSHCALLIRVRVILGVSADDLHIRQ